VTKELQVCQLGVVEYRSALELQEQLRLKRQSGETPDTLLVLEHLPVYTRGRRSEPTDLPNPDSWYQEKGIDVVDTKRGGKITYHGPGQLVCYPIIKTSDVVAFVRQLEQVMIQSLAELGITAATREGKDYTGVWVQNRKIGSIGLHLSKGVTTHGFAVNVNNDLGPFNLVTACGLPDVSATSIERELKKTTDFKAFQTTVVERFTEVGGYEPSRPAVPYK